jgi:hypothetical protein
MKDSLKVIEVSKYKLMFTEENRIKYNDQVMDCDKTGLESRPGQEI